MTWSLIKYIICLLLFLGLDNFLISCSFNFSISSIDFKLCYHFQIMVAIVQGFRVISQTHTVWLCRDWGVRWGILVFNIFEFDLWWTSIAGDRSLLLAFTSSKDGRCWAITVKYNVVIAGHLLIKGSLSSRTIFNEDTVFNLFDSFTSLGQDRLSKLW